jgi:hypothetical protein
MNVEIGAEAALFPEKEYIDGIAVAVQCGLSHSYLPSKLKVQASWATCSERWEIRKGKIMCCKFFFFLAYI